MNPKHYDLIVVGGGMTGAAAAVSATRRGLHTLLVEQSGATLVGCGICIEKAFQPGGDMLRSKGVRVESLARVKSMSEENGIEFC